MECFMEWLKHSAAYLLLHVALLIYALAGIFSKTAGGYELMSWDFILYYGAAMILLVIYAGVWQQVLKRMPLSVAFANKAVVIVWGMIFGTLIFREQIRWNMILGAAVIFAGIILVSNGDADSDEDVVSQGGAASEDGAVLEAGLDSGEERDTNG